MEDLLRIEKAILIGNGIRSIWISYCKEYLMIKSHEGDLVYKGSDDCCGASEISAISGIEFLDDERVTFRVTDIEHKTLPDNEDYREHWGWKISTTMGVCDIEFRYGGNYSGYMERLNFGSYIVYEVMPGVEAIRINEGRTDRPEKEVMFKRVKEDFC